ncbi:MAG: folylpolyglutamate synthase/dihydrofolate synthase family protein [Cyclobacteriaceae bacterium]
MDYQEALDFLYNRLPMYQRVGASAFKKDLGNTLRLSQLLGDPHKDFKSVHIAGTNGKGSSAHALASILQEAGYKTGLYTSPHLKSYRERIRVNGEMIPENFVTGFVNEHEDEILKISPSFFEITVVMAYAYFAHQQVDIAIIETGLGGRLDSTNIITPLVSLITTIGRDHEDLLGNTLESIAFEKAGIIKEHVPVVIGDISGTSKEVILARANEMKSKVVDVNNQWQINENDSGQYDFIFQGVMKYSSLDIALKGQYFLKNIPPVLAVASELGQAGFQINEGHLRMGLKNINANTGLKGRWQELSQNPLIICDIGHNEDGIREVVQQLKRKKYKQLHVVFGTVSDKSIDNILSLLIKEAKYYFCAAKVPRALPADALYNSALRYGLHGEVFSSVNAAICEAQKNAGPNDLIFIGGSTFVVAEIENL